MAENARIFLDPFLPHVCLCVIVYVFTTIYGCKCNHLCIYNHIQCCFEVSVCINLCVCIKQSYILLTFSLTFHENLSHSASAVFFPCYYKHWGNKHAFF